ncbi:MAG: hypothetical protein NTZ13_05245 [Candidatus Parcubacteria bacterium]|nr:hypothetical protein [Candidatus Parcubacteria bacterium]
MTQEKLACLECGSPAEWIRYTQFSGNHPYCEACAKKETDFPEGNGSYSDWDKWPPEENRKKEDSTRLHQIRKEICEIREESDAKIALLQREAEQIFEEAPTFWEIPLGQKFMYDLYGPICKKTGDSREATIESEHNKGMRFLLRSTGKVFLIE